MPELQEELQTDGEVSIGPWILRGAMTILHPKSLNGALTNSTVYKAKASCCTTQSDEGTTPIAVKTVDLNEDEKNAAMIKREIGILGKLGSAHPHVLPMLYCAERANDIIILFPLAANGDLAGLLNIGVDCIEELEVRRLTHQIMSALSFVHGKSLIHGDIAPQNLLLTKDSGDDSFLVQLCDFGLSLLVPEGRSSVEWPGVQGSYGYIPLEMKREKPITYAADLFALGVIAFRLLGGHDPFYPPSAVDSLVEFETTCWTPVSNLGRTFVTQLLSVDPVVRGTSSVCSHAWLGCDESFIQLQQQERGSLSPTPVPDIHFKGVIETAMPVETTGGYSGNVKEEQIVRLNSEDSTMSSTDNGTDCKSTETDSFFGA
jgi:serine/threonine protein kinase